MSSTVPCPECHEPARIVDSFTVQRDDGGPGRYLRVRCEGPMIFIVSADEDLDVEDPRREDARH